MIGKSEISIFCILTVNGGFASIVWSDLHFSSLQPHIHLRNGDAVPMLRGSPVQCGSYRRSKLFSKKQKQDNAAELELGNLSRPRTIEVVKTNITPKISSFLNKSNKNRRRSGT
jgi:hypothetical protein